MEGNEISRFTEYLKIAKEVDLDLDVPYGKESGFKTILHLALELEEEGEEYVKELITHLGSVAWQAVNVPTNNKRARIVSVGME